MTNQFNSFNDFWISAIYCSFSFGFKNVRNVIEIVLKSLFLQENLKNRAAAGGSEPQASLCDTLELPQFVQHWARIRKFLCKKTLLMVQAPSFPFSKILVALLVAFTASDRFSSDYRGRARNELRNAASLTCLFSDVNTGTDFSK